MVHTHRDTHKRWHSWCCCCWHCFSPWFSQIQAICRRAAWEICHNCNITCSLLFFIVANKLYLPVNGAFPFPFATAHETCRKVYNENIFSLVLLGKTRKIEKPAREMAKGKGNNNGNGNLLFNSPNCQLHNPKHTFSPNRNTPLTLTNFSVWLCSSRSCCFPHFWAY